MPLSYHISISVQALTKPKSTSRLNNQTLDLDHAHSLTIVSILCYHTPAQRPSNFSCQKPTPYKVRVVFSKPVHAVRARGGSPSTNHDPFTAKPSSYHVHATLQVTPPPPPIPPFLLTQNPNAQCAV